MTVLAAIFVEIVKLYADGLFYSLDSNFNTYFCWNIHFSWYIQKYVRSVTKLGKNTCVFHLSFVNNAKIFILFIHIVLIFCLVVSTTIGQECNKCSTQWRLVEFLMLKKEGLTLTSLFLFHSLENSYVFNYQHKMLHSWHKFYFLAH
jgi:hypothetical protein